ncbi:MAG: peptidoglycan endopeptidase [Brevundimonas sp.]|nr:MAG: peptidoglycan endopeptidase [Brevundimonas sp.]
MHGVAPVADIRAAADPASARIDQLLSGEIFEVLDQVGDRVWGRARRDGVVGWMALADLKAGAPVPSRRVARAGGALPLNALTNDGDAAIGDFARDPVAVAESLLGVPHSLGARSSISTDCAGLVQQALYACGLPGPRYADQQAELGQAVDRGEARRGDLVIWLHAEGGPGWSGHSALMLDADRVIHAAGDKGAVVIEPFAEADARYRADGFTAPVFRRL